jgi:pheophorbide a oxygenase
MQILGRKVVVWYDKEAAAWRTFLDMCPHRLAPLSEGRIDEQGCIQCCYHGWSFKGDGSCARIPQALGEGPEARAARNYPNPRVSLLVLIWCLTNSGSC